MSLSARSHPAPRTGLLVRAAQPADIPAIRSAYAHHVLHGLASFEEQPPDAAEMERRRAAIAARGLPYLVAEGGGRLLGFAYAGPYRLRPAYRYTVEDSVYVAPGALGQGIGRTLLQELILRCTGLGLRQMVAVIGDSGNSASIRLHETLGFRRAGLLGAVGFKFGGWVDSVLMQRPLGEGDATLPG